MANSKSALKRVRQTETRTSRNRSLKRKVKTLRRNVEESLKSGDHTAAGDGLKKFASAVDRASKTNLLHKNTASRLKGRLTLAVKASLRVVAGREDRRIPPSGDATASR